MALVERSEDVDDEDFEGRRQGDFTWQLGVTGAIGQIRQYVCDDFIFNQYVLRLCSIYDSIGAFVSTYLYV